MPKKILHKSKDSKKAGKPIVKSKKETIKKKARETKKPVSVKKSTKKNAIKKTASTDKLRSKKIASSATKEKVVLPGSMPLSSVNKSIALRKELDKYIQRSVYIVAYVTAICFILVGSTVAFSEILGNKNIGNSLKAETISLSQTSSTTYESSQTFLEPEVSIIDTIPSIITEDYRVNFVAKNVSQVEVYMNPLGGNNGIRLSVQNLIDDKYRTFIRTDVPSLYYTLKIIYYPTNGSSPKALYSKEFFVGTVEQENLFNNPEQVIEVNSSDSVLDTASGTTESTVTNDVTSPNSADEILEDETVLQNTDTDETNLESKVEDEVLIEKEETVTENEATTSIDFKIINVSTTEFAGTVSLPVRAPLDFGNILLYARPLNSITPVFVTSARIINDSWVFIFDTRNLPNNEYEFFARTTFKNEVIKTPSIKRKVLNTNETSLFDNRNTSYDTENQNTSTVNDEFKERIVTNLQTGTVSTTDPTTNTSSEIQPIREFARTTEIDFKPTVILDEEVSKATDELLNNNLVDFQDLLRRYAVALQSEDEVLISAAKQNLVNKRESIILSTLNDDGLKGISDNLDEEMIERIESLKTRVETFEQIRRDKSNGETSIDSDGDGISDFDEINLYKTDPNNPDTDNDGFNDGIEIIRGFNPNSDESESAIVFESPKESKFLEQEDLLLVESVIPVVTNNSSDDSVIKAEIRGKSLPNSFVTLYIFSTPTIVTIKTDADGSFVYTFDKELEDGEHEVYVAVTDNTGSIIAQSKPFSFVKQAEAFEPIGSGQDTVFATSVDSVNTSYNLAIGLAVLSLGIILLMLGIGLRTKSASEELALGLNKAKIEGLNLTESS